MKFVREKETKCICIFYLAVSGKALVPGVFRGETAHVFSLTSSVTHILFDWGGKMVIIIKPKGNKIEKKIHTGDFVC